MNNGHEERQEAPSHPWLWLGFAFLLLAFLSGLPLFLRPAQQSPLDPQEKWGRQIFFEGTSPTGGTIKAYIGHSRVELPGSAATCASCHGPDGLGRPESGVIPSDITWDHLMKRYGHTHLNGRKHPAFTEATLKKCILTGYDPGGNKLNEAMPTYSMSAEDINALVAYMKRVQNDSDPGITEAGIRIGILLPSSGPVGEIARGMRAVTAAYFEEINSRGGIYNRKIELVESLFDNSRESALSGLTSLVEKEDVFALVGGVIVGADREVAQRVEEQKIPLIGPFTLSSSDPFSINEFTFYLFSGLNEQVRALVKFAAEHLKLQNPRVAILGSGGEQQEELKGVIEEAARAYGWTSFTVVNLAEGGFDVSSLAGRLKKEETDMVFYLGTGGLKALLEEVEKPNRLPYVLMPGAHVQEEMFQVPPAFQKKIYLSYPILPSDQSPGGMSELKALLEKHNIPMKHWTSQVSALSAAKVLVEGLKGAGRDLSRAKLIRSLEQLYQFQTGLTPPITFGSNRRIGALGSHVVTLDLDKKDFVPVGGWFAVFGM